MAALKTHFRASFNTVWLTFNKFKSITHKQTMNPGPNYKLQHTFGGSDVGSVLSGCFGFEATTVHTQYSQHNCNYVLLWLHTNESMH